MTESIAFSHLWVCDPFENPPRDRALFRSVSGARRHALRILIFALPTRRPLREIFPTYCPFWGRFSHTAVRRKVLNDDLLLFYSRLLMTLDGTRWTSVDDEKNMCRFSCTREEETKGKERLWTLSKPSRRIPKAESEALRKYILTSRKLEL